MLNKKRILFIVLILLCVIAAASISGCTEKSTETSAANDVCDRECLEGFVTTYIEAMLTHNPGSLPVTENVRFTEDCKEIALGEGLWKNISGLTGYRRDILDVRQGVAVSFLVVEEAESPVLFVVRLKVDDRKITEVETTVVRNQKEGMLFNLENLQTPSETMTSFPAKEQLNTREEMIEMALTYPAGLKVGSFEKVDSPMAENAYRYENGQLMAGPGCDFFEGCDNMKKQFIPTLAGITHRVIAVDEEQGIVAMRMNFGPGSLFQGDGALDVWHSFKIYDGRMHAAEAYCEIVPPRTGFGWEEPMDRAQLVDLMDRYLAALVKHNPAGIPLAMDVKLVENTKPTPIGEGLWKTAGKLPTDFKIYVADPVENRIGFMGVMESDGKPVLLGARLKLANGQIVEIDHMVSPAVSAMAGGSIPEGLKEPRPALVEKLAESERTPREEMLKAALSYYPSLELNDGSIAPYADECQRNENGMTTANNQNPQLGDGAMTSAGGMLTFMKMTCADQMDTGMWRYITDINQLRPVAIDEEMGLVMVYSVFNHDGEPDPMPVVNIPELTERKNEWGQFTVPAAHIYKIRNGKIYEIEAMAILDAPYLSDDGWSCTRKCLAEKMDQYLDGLAKNDPSGLPLAWDVKLVENTKKTPIGEGLWKTATGGPTNFKIVVADPVSGEVAFMGVIEENEKPTIAAIRLKIVDHKIKKIDHLVVHNEDGAPLSPNMSEVRPALLERQPKMERVSRARMIEAANAYYEAIVQDSGDVAPFADECQRRENGLITANNPEPLPEDADEMMQAMAAFGQMTCREQLNTGVMSYITDITDRRVFAVDEEKGLVFAFSIFRHNGEPKVLKIKGVDGVTERENSFGVFDLPAAHIYKIRNGEIYDIEAIGYIAADHGITTGWE